MEHETTTTGDSPAGIDDLTVSLIIRAFTEERLLDTRAAIDSILVQTRMPDEILVVIDKNPGLLATLKADYEGEPLVRVIPNDRLRGIGGGSNTALLHATSDVICYLEDDATAEPDWLSEIVAPLADPAIVAVGGFAEPNWDGGEAPSWFPAEFHWTVGSSNPVRDQSVVDIRNVWGGNNAFRRQAVVDNGGFVEKGLGRIGSNALGGEDTELCIRLRQANPEWRIVVQPAAVIHHRVPETRRKLKYFIKRCRMEGHSKALLSHQVGPQAGLSEEASYAAVDLPKAVLRLMFSGVRHRQVSEFQKAGAIVAGLGFAAVGMVYGRVSILAGRTERLEPVERPLVATLS